MAYVPINNQMFTAAYSGALAGMRASERENTDPSPSTYADSATVAGAWAQSFDTAWNDAAGANSLQVECTFECSYALWAERGSPAAVPPFSTPSTYTVQATAVVAMVTAAEAYYTGQGIVPPPFGGGGNVNIPNLSFTSMFVNTATGSDSNPGTALLPIRTTAHLNTLLFGNATADTSITYQTDDTSGTPLNLTNVNRGTFNLTVNGTPQVLHNGGTLNAGTITINPAAGGGGQPQTAHTSDIADFAPFVVVRMGGTAAATNATRLNDTVTGGGAWIADGAASATAQLSRPVKNDGTAGAITSGDHYTITRGSILTLAAQAAPSSSGGALTFNDFAFTSTSVGVETAGQGFSINPTVYNRCSFAGPLLVGGEFNDCASTDSTQGGWIGSFSAGLLMPNTGSDEQTGVLNLSGDVYVTGPSSLSIGGTIIAAVFISAGIGSGVQLNNLKQSNGALVLFQGAIYANSGLLWGNGNTGAGVVVRAACQVEITNGTPATVTGTGGDFKFEGTGLTFGVARAWDNSVGAYTEAGGVATRATTWANLAAAIGGGGFGQQAHCVELGASLIGP